MEQACGSSLGDTDGAPDCGCPGTATAPGTGRLGGDWEVGEEEQVGGVSPFVI